MRGGQSISIKMLDQFLATNLLDKQAWIKYNSMNHFQWYELFKESDSVKKKKHDRIVKTVFLCDISIFSSYCNVTGGFCGFKMQDLLEQKNGVSYHIPVCFNA